MWDDDTEQPYLELKGTDSTGAGTVFKLYISGKDAMSMLVTFSSD